MKTLHMIAILGLLAACGGSGSGDDWTKKAVKPVSATVGGVAFTIDLPEGMRQKDDGGQIRWDFLVGEYVKNPEITIGTGGYAPTLDDYVKTQPDVETWVRKEALPDGYIVSYENTTYKGKEDYLVYASRTIGGKVLTCHARVTPWTRGASVKDKLPLVEKICLSLR